MDKRSLKSCASELGKLGAKARWAGRTKPKTEPKPKRAKGASGKGGSKKRVSSSLSTIAPSWGSGSARRPLKVEVRPGGVARPTAPKLLGPGEAKREIAPPPAPRPTAKPLFELSSPPPDVGTPVGAKQLTAARVAINNWIVSQEKTANSTTHARSRITGDGGRRSQATAELAAALEETDMRLIAAQPDVGAVLCATLGERPIGDGEWSPFQGVRRRAAGDTNGAGIVVRVSGSNGDEHGRAIARAIRMGVAAYNAALGAVGSANDADYNRLHSYGQEPLGPTEPLPGVERRVKASHDGKRWWRSELWISVEDYKGQIPPSRDGVDRSGGAYRALAHALVAIYSELARHGYPITVNQILPLGNDDLTKLQKIEGSIEEAANGLASEVFAPGPVGYSASRAQLELVPMPPSPSIRPAQRSKAGRAPKKSPVRAEGAVSGKPRQTRYDAIRDDESQVMLKLLSAFGVTPQRQDALMQAISSWLQEGGNASVYIRTRKWVDDPYGGDGYITGGSVGIYNAVSEAWGPAAGERSTDRDSYYDPYFASESGDVEHLRIDLGLAPKAARFLNTKSALEAFATDSTTVDSVRSAGIKIEYISSANEGKPLVEVARDYRGELSVDPKTKQPYLRMTARVSLTIGYSKRLKASQGTVVAWSPKDGGEPLFSRSRWDR